MDKIRQWLFVRSHQPENLFGPFTREILRSEGLNGFRIVDIDNAGIPELKSGDLIVLTRCFLDRNEMQQLYNSISNGACMVCLQPSSSFAGLFGWHCHKSIIYPGWIRIREGYPGSGHPIQTHVPITKYSHDSSTLNSESLADAVQPDWQESEYPAVVSQRVGLGRIALFFYDLPKAIALIRFGNPDLASFLTSGHWPSPHAFDLFPESHLDPRCIDLPQADYHGQLLAKILTDISPYPLARFWYYPRQHQRSAVMFTSDDDYSKPEQFRQLSAALLKRNGHATFYLMEKTLLSEQDVAGFRAQGHTFAPHIDVTEKGEMYFIFPEELKRETGLFAGRFGTISSSLQCHWAPWPGYMSCVPECMKNGYRMLCAYLSFPVISFMCGSGRPLKFVNLQGNIYDCWQQPIISYDDETLQEPMTDNPREFVDKFDNLLRAAVDRHHSAFGMLSHPISYATYSKPYIDAVLDSVQNVNVPIYNGDEWCAFNDQRYSTRIEAYRHRGNGFSWTISTAPNQLSLMIPVSPEQNISRVSVEGKPVEGTIYRRLEQDYFFVDLDTTDSKGEIHVELIGTVKKSHERMRDGRGKIS